LSLISSFIRLATLAYGERRLIMFNAADFRRYGDHIELAAT
jgi:hypothetical protein